MSYVNINRVDTCISPKSVVYRKPKVKYKPIKTDWIMVINWSMLAVVYGALAYSLIFG